MSTQNIALVGLPESGKTTFIAALWAAFTCGNAPGGYELGSLNGDVAHLNRLKERWLMCRQLDRTLAGVEPTVTLPLRECITGVQYNLQVPDLAGESYEKCWEGRTMPNSLVTVIRNAGGVMLFISSLSLVKPIRMDQALAAIDGLIGRSNLATEGAVAAPVKPPARPWRPEMAPTQVVLVEMLQFVSQIRALPKLSVAISAWDTVASTESQTTPLSWLERELPLLAQFIESRQFTTETRIFGLSAQGGDYGNDKTNLLGIEPSLRPKVFDGEGRNLHDIMAPVKWLTT